MTTSAPLFRRVRAGYEPDAVDRHLHQVAGRLRAAEARANETETVLAARDAALASAQAEIATAARQTRPDLVASDLVVDAERRAEELIAEARREAAQIRLRAQTDAEGLAQQARSQGDALLARAEHEAAVVDERARQEFFWRRRQLQADADELRAEQERINRQRVQIREQLSALSALALQQTTSAPSIELMLDDDLVDQAAS